jgi:hypothetical protein
VSERAPLDPRPPKRTNWPVAESFDIDAPERTDGLVVGARWVQVVPLQLQVSPRSPLAPVPPKRRS